MKNIVILLATAALLSGCGGGSGKKSEASQAAAQAKAEIAAEKACGANAKLVVKGTSVDQSNGKDANQKVLVPGGKVISENTVATIYLSSGKVQSHTTTQSENDPEDTLAEYDFAKKTLIMDGETVSFSRDEKLSAALGQDVFVTNEEETKAAIKKASNADKDRDMTICSASKAKISFSYDEAKKTVATDFEFELIVKLDDDFYAEVQSGALVQEDPAEE
ncbi:MAG: hypothetical protein AABZ31_08115 [Bdellovibrionota bacterium]